MARSFHELNNIFAKLQREFNATSDNQVRAVILEEMRQVFNEMSEVLHPEEPKKAAG
jgi:hypothetical protein